MSDVIIDTTNWTTEQTIEMLRLSETARSVLGYALLGEKRPKIAKTLGITRQRASQLIKYLHKLELLPADVLPENPNMTRKSAYERLLEAEKPKVRGSSLRWPRRIFG